ncbi:hypothetical protein [Marinobacterium litorale]|uniref:hypothetical protein n=1 Tax=Marinobacterium litorale TaxID=404770 RepID=UPI0004814424|nr:hypothetical protein [Marinobacterium litorale]
MDELLAVIQSQETDTVVINSARLQDPDALFLACKYADEQYGLLMPSRVLSAPQFNDKVKEQVASAVFTENPNEIQVTYSWTTRRRTFEGEGVQYAETLHEELVNIPVSYDPKADYYQVVYSLYDPVTSDFLGNKFWLYELGSGIYPDLDSPESEAEASPYFPVIPIRENNLDLTREEVRTGAQYLTSKALLKKTGIAIDSLAEGINDNPDVDDIDHAYVMFGFNIMTDSEYAHQYLFDYFKFLYNKNPSSKVQWVLSRDAIPSSQFGYIQKDQSPQAQIEHIGDAGLRVFLKYNYIDVSVKYGSIGSVGTVTREVDINGENRQMIDPGQEGIRWWVYNEDILTLRKQITSHLYEEITIHGLQHYNNVYNEHDVIYTLEDAQTEDGFLIPLNYHIINDYSVRTQNGIYYDSFQMVINSYEKVKLAWYETTFFKFIMTVGTFYLGGMASTLTSIGETFATQGLIAGATALGKTLAVAYVVNLGFKLLVDIIGIEAAFISAFVLSVYTFGKSIKVGSLKGVPFAEELLFTVNGIIGGIQSSVQADLEDLMDEYKDFQKESEEKQERLDAVTEMLETSDIIDPYLFINSGTYYDPSETPDDFYQRTIHTGNVGTLALDAISYFVDTMLALPKTSSTV